MGTVVAILLNSILPADATISFADDDEDSEESDTAAKATTDDAEPAKSKAEDISAGSGGDSGEAEA